jgi:RNA polymerase sigma-32 factor
MQQRLELPDLSVDAPLGMEDDGADMHSLLPDPGDSVEDSILDMQFSEAIRDAVEGFRKDLDDKQQAILDRRLFTSEPVTLQIIADEFGLSRERIRQIESKLKLELKSFLADTLSLGSEGQVVIVDSDPVN